MWSNLYMWRRFLALQMESLRLLVDFQFLKIEHGIKVRLKMRKWMKKKQSGKLQLDSLSLCFCYVVMSLWKLDMVKRLEWKWKREWRKNRAANCSLIRSRSVSRSVFVPRRRLELPHLTAYAPQAYLYTIPTPGHLSQTFKKRQGIFGKLPENNQDKHKSKQQNTLFWAAKIENYRLNLYVFWK